MRRRSTRISSSVDLDVVNTTTRESLSTKYSVGYFVKRLEKLNEDQKNAVRNAGFGSLLLIPIRTLNKNLLAQLIDTWDVQKQAFLIQHPHNATLLRINSIDIALILGLRVLGRPVCLDDSIPIPFLNLEHEYGADSTNRLITLSSLEKRLDSLGPNAHDDFLRTFLLFCFGAFLFPNTNGKVDSRYLFFLNNLEQVSQYAWGDALLHDLLTWLNRRKQHRIQYVGGCLFFLQIWAFEHIDIARPSFTQNHLAFPRATRWENSKSHQRQWFTTKFQELQDQQIVWELQPTTEELEVDIIRELVEIQNEEIEFHQTINISDAVVLANETVGQLELETDTVIIDQEVRDTVLEQKTLEENPDALLDNGDIHFTSFCVPETLQEHVELELTSKESSPDIIAGHEDNLRSENDILEQQVMTLKKENFELKKKNDELKKENELFRVQLLESRQAEDHLSELKKEVESIRSKNELLSRSSNGLVEQLKKLLFDDNEFDINDA